MKKHNPVVYKLTREDGLEYIGVTIRLNNRLNAHRKSLRFKMKKIANVTILGEFDSYEKARLFEEESIKRFDTFKNGLNVTETGGGYEQKHLNFGTRGYIFSPKSRALMSKRAKDRNAASSLREWWANASEERKLLSIEKMSKVRKGRSTKTTISEETIRSLYILYAKRPYIEGVGSKLKNGKILTYESAFSNMYAERFKMTNTHVRNLIKGKLLVWRNLYETIVLRSSLQADGQISAVSEGLNVQT